MHQRADFSQGDPSWDPLEAAWMRQMAAGGPQGEVAFGSLFSSYAALFVRWLSRYGLSPHDAQDVTQDLWLKEVVPASKRWKEEVPVRIYLRGMLRIARRRYFHERGHQPAVESTAVESVADEVESARPLFTSAPVRPTDWLDFARCVRRVLARFQEDHPRLARLLVLVHVEELSLDEAAELLGGDARLAKGQVFSARRKIGPEMRACIELWPG